MKNSTIRLATADDAAAVASIYAPAVEASWISFEERAPDATEMRARITATLAGWPWLVTEEDGAVVGFAYSGRHHQRAAYRWSVDTSVYLAESARGRGVGRALYGPLLAILRAQGFYRAHAGIALPNDASVGLHRALGFEDVGVYREVGFKHGAWHDVLWLARALAPAEPQPRDPVALADLPAAVLRAALQEA